VFILDSDIDGRKTLKNVPIVDFLSPTSDWLVFGGIGRENKV
jgi:hypothetical protein